MLKGISWAAVVALLLPATGSAFDRCEQTGTPATQSRDENRGDSNRRQPPPKWWIDEPMRTELGITDQQSAAVEQVWQKSIPKLREMRGQLDKLEETLSQMILNAVDEPTLVAQIDKVETARAEANKARMLMLYRMNRVLTADQRLKVKAIFDKREASHRGSGDRRR
jgi:Spy/CpxP family protein refolding chaperone